MRVPVLRRLLAEDGALDDGRLHLDADFGGVGSPVILTGAPGHREAVLGLRASRHDQLPRAAGAGRARSAGSLLRASDAGRRVPRATPTAMILDRTAIAWSPRGRIESSRGVAVLPRHDLGRPASARRPRSRPCLASNDLEAGPASSPGLMDNARRRCGARGRRAGSRRRRASRPCWPFPTRRKGRWARATRRCARRQRLHRSLLPAPELAIVADVQQGGGDPDADTRGGVENSTRLGGGAVLAEFSSLARGAVTPLDLYGLARHMADVLAGFGVRVQESNNAYSSRSDDVSVMLKTPNILLLGFPGFNRHFDRGLPRAHLDDVVHLAKAAGLHVGPAARFSSSGAARCSRDDAMIDIATVGWLTMDDIVLPDHSCRPGVLGGGALYSAIGAQIWADRVGIHSVTGREVHDDVRARDRARAASTRRASAPSMATGCSSGCCTRARPSSSKCPSSTRRPPTRWIAAAVRCPRPIAAARGLPRRAAIARRLDRERARAARLAAPASRHAGSSFGRIHRPPPLCRSRFPRRRDRLPAQRGGDRADLGSAGHRRLAARAGRAHGCHMGVKLGEQGSLVCDAGPAS